MRRGTSSAWPRVGAMAHELTVTADEPDRLVSLLGGFGLSAVQLGVSLLS